MEKYEEINVRHNWDKDDPFTEERYKQFYKFFPPNVKTVLDIGCSTGGGGRVLKGLHKDLMIYGLDASEDSLSQLPKGVYDKYVQGLSAEIPYDDCTFDVCVAGEFIEHLYPVDVDQTLSEVFRVLKVGGRFLLTTPNPDDIKRRLRNQTVLRGAHVSQHFHDALRFRLRMIGFSKVRIHGSGKVTRYLGDRFPFLSLYGSYLAMGDKY